MSENNYKNQEINIGSNLESDLNEALGITEDSDPATPNSFKVMWLEMKAMREELAELRKLKSAFESTRSSTRASRKSSPDDSPRVAAKAILNGVKGLPMKGPAKEEAVKSSPKMEPMPALHDNRSESMLNTMKPRANPVGSLPPTTKNVMEFSYASAVSGNVRNNLPPSRPNVPRPVSQANNSHTFDYTPVNRFAERPRVEENTVFRMGNEFLDPIEGGFNNTFNANRQNLPERANRTADGFNNFALPESLYPEGDRRNSDFFRMMNIKPVEGQTVTRVLELPSAKYIFMEKCTYKDYFKMVTAYAQYMAKGGAPLNLVSYVSLGVRDRLLGRHPDLSEATFYQLSNEQFFFLLEEMLKAISKLEFIKTVRECVNCNWKGPVNAEKFPDFHREVSNTMRKFLSLVEMMSRNNQANTPPTNNKEGGLIKVLISMVPKKYLKRVYGEIKTDSKNDTLRQVISKMAVVMEKHLRSVIDVQAIDHFWQEGEDSDGSVEQEPRKKGAKKNNKYGRGKDFYKGNRFAQGLAAILGKDNSDASGTGSGSSDESSGTQSDSDDSGSDSEESADEQELAVISPLKSKSKFNGGRKSPTRGGFRGRSRSPRRGRSPGKGRRFPNHKRDRDGENKGDKTEEKARDKPKGCFATIVRGKCERGSSCKYSHERDALEETAMYYARLLNNSSYLPPKSSRNPADLAAIRELTSDDELFLAMMSQQLCMSELPEIATLPSAITKGTINMPEGGRILVNRVLFDTGALHGSYISAEFARSIPEIWKKRVRNKATVRLADNRTLIDITHTVNLSVTFADSEGNEHTGDIRFYVFPSKHSEMIIGWPAIIGQFHELLKNMVDDAWKSMSAPMQMEMELVGGQKVSSIEETHPYEWQQKEQEAPEDAETPLPCGHTFQLNFLDKTFEEALEEFKSQIETHVSPEFMFFTDIVKLLTTKGPRVFIPHNWDGINGIELFELLWKGELPESIKPKARSVNPRLFDVAQKEFRRLLRYFYRESLSAIASCLVIAPKATAPFIRFCGDYVTINKYIVTNHYPIPNVKNSLEKLQKYKIFLDFDLVNAFHQIKLGPITSARLSVQTPWGQVEPMFMPEGIGPASGKLQQVVSEVFAEIADFSIIIFDNLLVLAHDYEDAYKKVEMVLDICIRRNVFLKFSKTWLGFTEVNFFGYLCKYGRYGLTPERKKQIMDMAFPRTRKLMRSFLGTANFFHQFVPHFSSKAAVLTEMTASGFNWDPATWKVDYVAAFESFKDELAKAGEVYVPDYDAEWFLRTDASQLGVGAVLLQRIKLEGSDEYTMCPIGFASQKFSTQARGWSTIEQEAFAMYYGVKHFEYYLRPKYFTLQTDHNNLVWIESSLAPKVIRWRIYLQSFNFRLEHIPGERNTVADWLSRMHEEEQILAAVNMDMLRLNRTQYGEDALTLIPRVDPGSVDWNKSPDDLGVRDFEDLAERTPQIQPIGSDTAAAVETTGQLEDRTGLIPNIEDIENAASTVQGQVEDLVNTKTPEELFKLIHGGRYGHLGARRTWLALNKHYPGHRIPFRIIEELVASCAICQKDRLGMNTCIQPLVRTLKPEHHRAMVGIDTLAMTPTDKHGNNCITVVVNHFTKLTGLYPAKDHTAQSAATALFKYICSYGSFDAIISDPGTEFINDVMKCLTAWLGIHHNISIVDRHESNGVERTNREVIRHLKALVMDERIRDKWSDDTVLPLVQYIINSTVHSETGITPFQANFGSNENTYMQLPENLQGIQRVNWFVKALDGNLKLLRALSREHQRAIAISREAETPLGRQNKYQPGDLVLALRTEEGKKRLPDKLSPQFIGPLKVISQRNNNVKAQHVVLGYEAEYHVSRLKLFQGSKKEAFKAAMLDNDQYLLVSILAYKGDPKLRTSLYFECLFDDGETIWKPYDRDLFNTRQYEEFCLKTPELSLLIYTAAETKVYETAINRKTITEVAPGEVVYVDLRYVGEEWYEDIFDEPDKYHVKYVMEFVYLDFVGTKQLKLEIMNLLTRSVYVFDHLAVLQYGNAKQMQDGWVLLGEEAIEKYPSLIPLTEAEREMCLRGKG